jgi:DNA invertase Pin-like site-specific DNA recombinase
LRQAGVHPDLIFIDEQSGRTFKREGLRKALRFLSAGSTLVFWKLDRLGRDVVEIILTVNRLDERGVKFRSLTEPFISTEARQTTMGFAFFVMTSMFGELESRLISERTKAGMRIARERGVKFNKHDFEALYMATGKIKEFRRLRFVEGLNIAQACEKLGIPRTTHTKWKEVFEAPDDIAAPDDIHLVKGVEASALQPVETVAPPRQRRERRRQLEGLGRMAHRNKEIWRQVREDKHRMADVAAEFGITETRVKQIVSRIDRATVAK